MQQFNFPALDTLNLICDTEIIIRPTDELYGHIGTVAYAVYCDIVRSTWMGRVGYPPRDTGGIGCLVSALFFILRKRVNWSSAYGLENEIIAAMYASPPTEINKFDSWFIVKRGTEILCRAGCTITLVDLDNNTPVALADAGLVIDGRIKAAVKP